MVKADRKYRDRLFHFLFGKDEEKQRALDRKDGVEDGILGVIDILRDPGLDDSAISEKIISRFQLSEDTAERLLRLAETK